MTYRVVQKCDGLDDARCSGRAVYVWREGRLCVRCAEVVDQALKVVSRVLPRQAARIDRVGDVR